MDDCDAGVGEGAQIVGYVGLPTGDDDGCDSVIIECGNEGGADDVQECLCVLPDLVIVFPLEVGNGKVHLFFERGVVDGYGIRFYGTDD